MPGRRRPAREHRAVSAPSAVDELRLPAGYGAYVHVPFCRSRCDYCAFATFDDRAHLRSRYVAAVVAEVGRRRPALGSLGPTTVFFGGGTPSLLEPEEVGRILDALQPEPGAEVTLEANPDDVSEERLVAWSEVGVNRLSLGVQSLDQRVLDGLGRKHDAKVALQAVELALGAPSLEVSVDVIFGGPGEDLRSWRRTIEALMGFDGLSHLSAYALTVEPGTPLHRDVARHPDEDAQAEAYELADEMLQGAGLAWYEISNWARPGHECLHNLRYWVGGDYLGFGSAAHSFVGGRRSWNVRTPERYIAAIESGREVEAAGEELDDDARRRERAWLQLRTRLGVPWPLVPPEVVHAGLVSRSGDRAVLTRSGRLVANEVACRLLV